MATTRLCTIEDREARPDDGHVCGPTDGGLGRGEPVSGTQRAEPFVAVGCVLQCLRVHPVGMAFRSETIYGLQHDPDGRLRTDLCSVPAERVPEGLKFDKPLTVVP